jgi:multidrug efflux pump subunit AcrB
MTVYVVMVLFFILGITAYYDMPREDFLKLKKQNIYKYGLSWNTAEDIERLVVDPLEEDIKNISNVVEVLSTSQEDYGIITVEFDEKLCRRR